MKDIDKKIDEALNFDALSEAEKVTGKSYKEDALTENIGMMAHLQNTQRTKELLTSVNDTVFDNTEPAYLKKVTDFGFVSILVEPFMNERNVEERLHILFHYEYSILLCFDTFSWSDDGSWAKEGKTVPPPSVNGGKFYYNWRPDSDPRQPGCTSSGGFVKETGIWSGDHDCREGLKHNITKLAKHGEFVKWVEAPFLWLLNYMDNEVPNYSYETINKERISKLPKEVQEIIKGA